MSDALPRSPGALDKSAAARDERTHTLRCVRQFSDAHLAALAVLVLAVALAVWAPRRHPGRWTVLAARLLAAVIFTAWAGEYLADVLRGTWTIEYDLPLQLTDEAIRPVQVVP